MFSKFDEGAKKVLVNMKKEMCDLRHPYIGTEHLLLSILKFGIKDDILKLNNYGITYDSFRNELVKVIGIGKNSSDYNLYTPLLKNVMQTATLNASDKGKTLVDSTELLMAIFDEGEGVAIRILIGMGVDIDKLYDCFYDKAKLDNGKGSSSSIDSFGIDLCKRAMNNEIDPVIGRDKEIDRILEILSRRTKNNPILIGEAGVGKTAIVEELARRFSLGCVSSNLKDKRIVSVSMSSLVAGTKYRGEFEERIEKMLSELERDEDIILFIDEIHTLVGAGGAEGAIDASNILKPALARGKIRVIGATTKDEYKKFIESDKALCRRFQKVDILEPDLDAVFTILDKLKPIYEEYHHVVISEEVIRKIIYLSNRYIYDRKMPDKAIDILDEVCSRVSIRNQSKISSLSKLTKELTDVKHLKNDAIVNNDFKFAMELKEKEVFLEDKKNRLEFRDNLKVRGVITLKDVMDVVEEKSRIPLFYDDNGKMINDICVSLKKKVIGQDKAIDEVCKSFKKIMFGLDSNRPYSYLFAGPTGVGKTLLVKEFASYCYGKDNFIRLDMSEYASTDAVNKIIGSSPGYVGYDDNKNVFELVKDNPYSVILLDEIEKAHPSVISLFFQILDEGKAKNSKGEEIHFDNTIIFMTSNIGYTSGTIGFGDDNNAALVDINNFLGEAFVNRIYKIICFDKIDCNAIMSIITSKINEVRKNYKAMGIKLSLSKKIVPSLVEFCDYEKYGARRVDKVIEDRLESLIIDKILLGDNLVKITEIKARELV